MPFDPNRRWPTFGLRTMFVVVTVLALVAGWFASKWHEVGARDRFFDSMFEKAAVGGYQATLDSWSMTWPFHNVNRIEKIRLYDDKFSDDDVQQLRRIFPGVSIYHYTHMEAFENKEHLIEPLGK